MQEQERFRTFRTGERLCDLACEGLFLLLQCFDTDRQCQYLLLQRSLKHLMLTLLCLSLPLIPYVTEKKLRVFNLLNDGLHFASAMGEYFRSCFSFLVL